MASARAHQFPFQFSGAGSQAFPLALYAILWRADEHFDQVVVQAIVELALKAPFKLRMVQVARVQIEVIGMYGDAWIPELDDQFNAIALGASVEIQQRVLVEAQLGPHAFDAQMGIIGHQKIVFDNPISWCILASFPPDPTLGSLRTVMRTLSTLAYWEGLILLGGLFGVVLWKLFTGGISLEQLLEGDAPDADAANRDSTYVSGGRTQLLAATVFVAGYYLLQVLHNPKQFPTLPTELVGALAGSQALYLGGKARAMLQGRVRDFFNRRMP